MIAWVPSKAVTIVVTPKVLFLLKKADVLKIYSTVY